MNGLSQSVKGTANVPARVAPAIPSILAVSVIAGPAAPGAPKVQSQW